MIACLIAEKKPKHIGQIRLVLFDEQRLESTTALTGRLQFDAANGGFDELFTSGVRMRVVFTSQAPIIKQACRATSN